MKMNIAHETSLIAALEGLAPHDHLCSIYETQEEQFAVAMPFIRIGIDRGEKSIYICDDGSQAAVAKAMYAEGIDVDRAIAGNALVLEGKDAAYLKGGVFDPDWMFTFWADATREAQRQGFSALRVTGETEWVLRGATGLERWMEYESRMRRMLSELNCLALCQYNRRLFPAELILDVIRTHPTVIYRGVVCRNMYHVPPDDFLETDHAAREVERLLTNIRDREDVEQALRQQRDELRESEARFREIIESIREVFWVWDAIADRLTFMSPTEEMFGRSFENLEQNSRAVLETIHPDDRVRVDEAGERLRQGMSFHERFRVVMPDGSIRWIRSRALPVREANGGFKRVVGVAEDITDQKRREEELQNSERLLRLVLDALPVGVAVVDHAGNMILTNPESERIWGRVIHSGRERYSASKAWSHSTGRPIARGEWASERALFNGASTVNELLDIESFDGARKTIQNSAVPIRNMHEHITGAVVVNEDITTRVAAERDLNDSYNQMRTLTGRLMRAQDDERRRIAQMLHETTAQDLAALKMHLARLHRTAADLNDSDRAVLLESIALAEQSMTEVRTLSYLLHPPFLDEMGLVSALRWYATGFAERSGIAVELELPDVFERPPLDTETALFRIVQESLINIHRHAGSLTASIRLQRDAETLVLAIEDRGRGIPNASLTQIMRGEGGVGVGIAGMHERIEQLGGTLEITSGDHGTIVRARLPLMSRAD
jgi:two-component system NarL family sensor kinase